MEATSNEWDETAERLEDEDATEAGEPTPRIAELDEQTGEWREIDRRGRRAGEEVGDEVDEGRRGSAATRLESVEDVMEEEGDGDGQVDSCMDMTDGDCGGDGEDSGEPRPPGSNGSGPDNARRKKAARHRARRAKPVGEEREEQQLMIPEWMLEVPPDLTSDWSVAAKP